MTPEIAARGLFRFSKNGARKKIFKATGELMGERRSTGMCKDVQGGPAFERVRGMEEESLASIAHAIIMGAP